MSYLDSPDYPASDNEQDLEDYRGVSVPAVAALVLGLLSPLAMIGPLLWIVPGVGVAMSLVALRGIAASDGALVGRGAARFGLCLALVFAAAASSANLSHSWWLRGEAREFIGAWFELLRSDEPHKAAQLTVDPSARQPLDGTLWTYYRTAPDARERLEEFVQEPLVHGLLALGDRAEVRYWATEVASTIDRTSHVSQIYAVTFGEGAERQTFFARLAAERKVHPNSGAAHWRVVGYRGGVTPFEPN